jgi:kynureninase
MIESEQDARRRDDLDELASRRDLFLVPPDSSGRYAEVAYFAGNSLGLQPKATRERLLGELRDWAELAVEGHFEAERPWPPSSVPGKPRPSS